MADSYKSIKIIEIKKKVLNKHCRILYNVNFISIFYVFGKLKHFVIILITLFK
jgi:hypothetical protein